ncbi:MAG: ABC transporter permease [Chitinophagaceae bacterium]|nr:ABC transporter permease [Chitinophagaceae bacterium]
MIRNYFLVAWRNVIRNPFYSGLNVLGLLTGILFFFLIGAYVWNEYNVNRHLRNSSRQVFLRSVWKDPNSGPDITTFGPLSKRLKENYPTLVANYYRWDGITSVVSKGDRIFREGIQLGDSTLLSMYGFDLLQGDKVTALNDPFSAVITKEAALKYFNATNVIGETLSIQNFSGGKRDFKITGVLDDIPENSVLALNDANHNNIFLPTQSYTYFGRGDFDNWQNIILPSYVELREGVKAEDLAGPIQKLIADNAPVASQMGMKVVPIPLTDYYLQKDNALVKRLLYALSFTALFLLLMAMVNYINLAVSRSASRIKEIGIRKVMGGVRSQLIGQFLSESFILVTISVLLAIILYPLFSPVFSQVIGKAIPSLSQFPLVFLFIPFGFVVTIGFLAGIYPAMVLSAAGTVDAVKGKFATIKEKLWLRKSLVGFQFLMAIVVLTAAIIITQQVNYFFSRNVGYDKEFIVAAQLPRDWSPEGVAKMEAVRDQFASLPQVANATLSFEIPNGNNGGQPPVYRQGKDSANAIAMQALVTDDHYADTYKIPMAAGTYFQSEGGFDSSKVILNQTAVKALGWKDDGEAIGRWVRIPGSPINYLVAGVMKDFHFGSMQQAIAPSIVFNVKSGNTYRYMSFKIKSGEINETISSIQKKWSQLLPGSAFEYVFIDDALKKLYATEIQMKKATYTATVLAIIIVLLGVVGLISLSIRQKVKEIGIRKVLGASVSTLIGIFMKEFMIVVLLASVVAIPAAYLLMREWLNHYQYRIDMTLFPFVISTAALLLVTALLILVRTFNAARTNPVKSLRTE